MVLCRMGGFSLKLHAARGRLGPRHDVLLTNASCCKKSVLLRGVDPSNLGAIKDAIIANYAAQLALFDKVEWQI